ncbi:MAG TPA: S8 family serine peptidase [Bacteroidales bacterium]|nr:S8 family serine peptidase [Bacteroidales bacterium]HPS17874.1 S8 family serine peptidase [Bacteroidales bacterium]
MKKYLLFSIIIIGIFITNIVRSQDELQPKIDSIILKKIKSENKTEFVVVLKDQADVSGAYKLKTKEEKGQYVYDLLTEKASQTQSEVLNIIYDSKAEFQSFWVVNAIWVKGNVDLVNKIAKLDCVREIIDNATYTFPKPIFEETNNIDDTKAVEWGISQTKADQVWALGFTGQGVVVAGEDTGYDWTHTAIKGKYRGWNGSTADHNYNWHDAIKTGNGGSCGVNSQVPCDDNSHGTHTMGTMVGDDGATNKIGMAPGAKWIGCRNMDQGAGTLTSYIDCFQFFLAPTKLDGTAADATKAPHVINNSWGCDGTEGCNSSNYATMETVINNLKAAGIVVVVSAGNDGSDCSTITTPAAIYDNSFVVGSTTSSDAISSFSSRGPVTVYTSTMVKPDISAPGSNIRSCVPGGSYSTMSGTSMAGPHVAGMVALIISANPSLAGNVDSIESVIKHSAVHLTSTQTCGSVSGSTIPNYTFGYGRIDALAAVNAVLTSLHENVKPQIIVNTYPNPITENVTFAITNLNEPVKFQLFDITGQSIITEMWDNVITQHELDLSNLSSGVYYYKLSNDNDNFEGKLLKVK